MKTSTRIESAWPLCRLAIFLILIIFPTPFAHAILFPGGGGTNAPLPSPLASWSFQDTTNWTDDDGYSPVSFANITSSRLGDGWSLVMNTNIPAWLQFKVVENDGTTNLTVDSGSLTFWFGAGWTSTNAGGLGPGEWSQLIDVGEWTSNSSSGYWGLSADPAGENIWFLAQDGLGDTYSLSAPVSLTTNYFHFVALTYSATNVSLYLDGQLATNDPGGLSIYPGSNVLSNGLFFGSDTNGNQEAQGLFNIVQTYNFPLDSNTVEQIYAAQEDIYAINPLDIPYMNALHSASPSSPSSPSYNEVTGSGYLQLIGSVTNCIDGPNADYVWITNVSATTVRSGGTVTMNLTFTIEGGEPGVPYDVFANSVLSMGTNGVPWSWMGQGYQCNTYTLTNLPSTTCFLILGTPQDTLGIGLTDAYQLLVTKTNPDNPSAAGDGISNGDKVAMGLNPSVPIPAIPSSFTVETCPQ